MNHPNSSNGNGRRTVDAEPVVDTEPAPTGTAYPMPRAQPGIVVNRPLIYVGCGVVAGIALTLWILSMCSKRMK